ncbi:GNAT family protein [Methylobacterium sp. 77]|uniref:GNAT family N-acetyltransferase n=1 Tax=Methylobacterium sp. 77 TaxID=1101192 RepID=UPI00038036F1|nr:GNAT family protein [Methylobacterium sp. 77]
MSGRVNEYGQPVGPVVAAWTPPPIPPRDTMQGRFCRIVPLDAERHTGDLFAALAQDPARWTYLPGEPPADEALYRARLAEIAGSRDPMHHAILDAVTGRALGVAAYLRIEPAHGCIEVGHIQFGSGLARHPAGTEAMALMMGRAFALGYRRYEWKCDSLNAPSRAAALRYGFTFEGIFRNAIVTKGRSRDTAWFSVIDTEWPRLRDAFEAWLAPGNFDDEGRQRRSLSALRG